MNFLSANLLVLFVILANVCYNPYAAELCISIFHLFVITAAFHARVRGSVSEIGKKQKMFLPHPRVKVSIVGSLRDREVACSASDRQGSNFESCVWRTAFYRYFHLQNIDSGCPVGLIVSTSTNI